MTCVAPTVAPVLGLPAPAHATGEPIAAVVSDLRPAERLAVLAPDALGRYAWGLWQDEMPFLQSLHAEGSITLRSVLPSITPVNFAAMVTGTDRDGHGIHTYKDDFQCETLFDVVREAGGRSAGVGLDGYTGAELLARFADMDGNAGPGSDDDVVRTVIQIADRDAPTFIIAQIGRVDDVFHRYGPSSPAVVPMLRETDARLSALVAHLTPLGYGVIILADHGQHDIVGAAEGEKKGGHGTGSDEDSLVPCTWTREHAPVHP